jgi:energy-coupling factor transport system ATP-binding protein
MATQVNIVFQDPDAQLITMYVEDEIAFGPENLRLPWEEIDRRVKGTLDLIDMHSYKNVYTWSLSGGQKQRVAFGSVLSMNPSILVLDEPTSNLDPGGTRSLFELLARLRQSSSAITLIAIEHKVDDLLEHVDRVMVLDEGKLIFFGSAREMLARHGDLLRERGLHLPMVAELALEARARGLILTGELPLTIAEARQLMPLVPSVPQGGRTGRDERLLRQPREPLIKFEDVTFSYPGRLPALKNINLEIGQGEIVAIIGQNGAGKTTLTKLIVGLEKPSLGRVLLSGEDIIRIPAGRLTERVGYVFQYPDSQLVTDTVAEEVAFSMRVRHYPEDQIAAKVGEALDIVGLRVDLQAHPLALSMGEKRRLSIATMLVLDQQVLILDEPTMGMDAGHVNAIMQVCRELQRRGKTILFVTHDMRVVAEWADRVVAMADNQIIYDGEPRRFFSDAESLAKAQISPPPICALRHDCGSLENAACATCARDYVEALLKSQELRRREATP